MSTSRDEAASTEDRLVTLLSHWLARHTGDAELRRGLEQIGTGGLAAAQAAAFEELLTELRAPDGRPGELEMLVRETLEAIALG